MRLIRLAVAVDRPAVGIGELLSRTEVDLLQLDYRRPRRTPAVRRDRFPEFAPGFVETVAGLQREFFLDNNAAIVASAGWANAMHCVEQAAHVMCEAGNGQVPLSAVRGANLLPILEFMESSGVSLRHAVTDRPFRELRSPVVAADLEIGAGPFAMALDEGARVLVAGCYCPAAPAIAAAVSKYGWSWDDYGKLAGAVAATQGAVWPAGMEPAVDSGGRKTPARLRPMVAELAADGAFTLTGPAAASEHADKTFERWIGTAAEEDGRFRTADVAGRLSDVRCHAAQPEQLAVTGAEGTSANDRWRLDIYYQSGFTAALLLEVGTETGFRAPENLTEALEASLSAEAGADDSVDVERLQSQRDPGDAPRWLSVTCHTKTKEACAAIVDTCLAFVARYDSHLHLVGSSPTVMVDYKIWPTWVPRDAVDLAIDTRPAEEWR